MKSRLILVLFAGVMITQSLSCDKFLQVQPRDYIFEEEAFSTQQGVESVLNGLYQSLSDSLLYGYSLSLNLSERMANYYTNASYLKDVITLVEKPLLSRVWGKSYTAILGINNFCKKLQEPGYNVLPEDQRKIFLGEAIALRAYIHLDLLRMFGPIYVSKPGALAIPYVRVAKSEAQPLLTASEVIAQISNDLDTALVLLENDPVRTNGANRVAMSASGDEGNIDFMSNRHRRMNYFAVKTLYARALLYAGNKTAAWETASSILLQQHVFFPWQTEREMVTDPVLSKEIFFGIENRKLYDYYRQMFSPALTDAQIHTPKPVRLDGIYNPASTDLRLKYWFKIGVEGNKSYKVFVKYSDENVKDLAIRYYQPLIKKSELYLIAAESAPDREQGYQYLNELRLSKGLTPLEYQLTAPVSAFTKAIQDEYQREFIGEGQTFFMFKRFNLAQIPNADGSGTGMENMTEVRYVPELPQDESYYR